MCCDDPPHKRYWRLYYLLDLIPPITSKQVKWNFRKVTLRHHYYQAYLVLYNRSRKYFYDTLGEDAYGFIVSGTWGPIVPLLGIVGTTLLYTIVMLMEIGLLLLFFAFLGARVDDVITWDWERVVAPLMAFGGIALLCSLFALVVSFVSPRTWREGMAGIDRVSPIGNCAAAICYFCLPFVIGYRIRDNTHAIEGTCLKYMVMPILGDILYYLTSLIWRWPKRLAHQMQIEDNETNGVVTWGIFFMAFLNMGCGIAQWVLIGKKIDGTMNRSWYIVFTPFCARAGIRITEACLRSLMKYYQGVRSKIGVAFDTVGAFFVNGLLLVSLYFVAVRIERGKIKCRMARALIPVYVTLAYMFLAMIITMIYLLIRSCKKSKEESRINNVWVPPQTEGPVLGVRGGTARNTYSNGRAVGSTSSSHSAPIPGEVRKDRNWDDFDGQSSPSSAAFPSELRDDKDRADLEPVEDDDEEYDEFYSDEEEEDVFPRESEGSPQSPYGSPHSDNDDDKNRSNYTDKEGEHDSSVPRDYEFPVAAATGRPQGRDLVDPLTASAPVKRSHSHSHSHGRRTPPLSQPGTSGSKPRTPPPPRADASSLTGDSEEDPNSDYTYEYYDESFTEQSGTQDDEEYYEYSDYSQQDNASESRMSGSLASSSFASSLGNSRR